MPIICHSCGESSPVKEAFSSDRSALFKKRYHCPSCATRRNASNLKVVLVGVPIATAFGACLVLLGLDVGWWLVNFGVLNLLLFLGVVPHEFAHMAMARWVGLPVHRVVLGFGHKLGETNVGGVPWEFRALPGFGLTFVGAQDIGGYRSRYFLAVLAGPLANALGLSIGLILGGSLNLGHLGGELPVWHLFVLANLFLLAVSLFPYQVATPAGKVPSDGLQLLILPFLSAAQVEERLTLHNLVAAHLHLSEERFGEARELVLRALARRPGDPLLRNTLAVAELGLGEYRRARTRFRQLLDERDLRTDVRGLLANNLAWSNLVLGDPDLLHEADTRSREALEVLPWLAAVQGTRGLTLVERGDPEAGIPFLRKALAQEEQASNRASILSSFALAYLKKQDPSTAKGYLESARRISTQGPLFERAQAALAKASPISGSRPDFSKKPIQANTPVVGPRRATPSSRGR